MLGVIVPPKLRPKFLLLGPRQRHPGALLWSWGVAQLWPRPKAGKAVSLPLPNHRSQTDPPKQHIDSRKSSPAATFFFFKHKTYLKSHFPHLEPSYLPFLSYSVGSLNAQNTEAESGKEKRDLTQQHMTPKQTKTPKSP